MANLFLLILYGVLIAIFIGISRLKDSVCGIATVALLAVNVLFLTYLQSYPSTLSLSPPFRQSPDFF